MHEEYEDLEEELSRVKQEAEYLEGLAISRGDQVLSLQTQVLELLDKLAPDQWNELIEEGLRDLLAFA